VALQDPPDCRGADAVAELEQLALESCTPRAGSLAVSAPPGRRVHRR